jgi:prepilin signal peptidase PulO-like enzyme (type II secretory pathway)
MCRSLFILLIVSATTTVAWAGDVASGLSPSSRAQMVAAEWITGAYLFATGATIGSFLNVVVYRLPHGQNLRRPKSRCPHCHTPLRWYDNLPVIGWMMVAGRCRYCGAGISPRYPIIEAACGGWFLTLGYIELLSGGASLPQREVPRMTGALWIVWTPQWELIGAYAYHLVLSCWLLVLMAWVWDRQRVPPRAVFWLLAMGAIPAIIWPNLRPVGVVGEVAAGGTARHVVAYVATALRASNSASGIVDALCGIVVGGCIGSALVRGATGSPFGGKAIFGTVHVRLILAAVGLFLGWQAVVCVAVPAAVVGLAVMVTSGGCQRSVLAATAYTGGVATLVFVASWRTWSEALLWLVTGPSPGAVISLVVIAAATGVCHLLANCRPLPMT